MTKYAIVLTIGAREAVREMEPEERHQFVAALKTELVERDGTLVTPHALVRPSGSPVGYPARYISSGHVVIFRAMTEDELKILAVQLRGPVAALGVIVHDALSSSETLPSGSVVHSMV
jgi:hypothetical protein